MKEIMKEIISTIWHNFIIFVLFLLIFYAGAVTGMYYENATLTINNKRMDKLETNLKELNLKIIMMEAIVKKK